MNYSYFLKGKGKTKYLLYLIIIYLSRAGLVSLRKLLACGVNSNVVDKDGRPPLLWAASSGSTDAVLALVNRGADISGSDNEGLTALHCASSRGHNDCVADLVTLCGADIHMMDVSGCTPLAYAVTLGHNKTAKTLLELGTSPNVQDKKGRTPAHGGAAKGQLETIKLLAKYKADLWLKNNKGNLPFHEAILSGRKDLIMYFLMQKPEAVHFENANGEKPIHMVAALNNPELCNILIEYKSEISPICRNSRGKLLTPLDIALHKGNKSTAKYLNLEGGISAKKMIDRSSIQKALANAVKEKQILNKKMNKLELSTEALLDETIPKSSKEGLKVLPSPDTTPAMVNKFSMSVTPRLTRPFIETFHQSSSTSSEKKSQSSYKFSDIEDSDSESDYYSYRSHRRKTLRKKVYSDPVLFTNEEDFRSCTRSVRSHLQHRGKYKHDLETSFPDVFPARNKHHQLESKSPSQSNHLASLDEKVVYTETTQNDQREDIPKSSDDSPIANHPTPQPNDTYVFEGSLKIVPFEGILVRQDSSTRNRPGTKEIFHEQKMRRKHLIENALHSELTNLQDCKSVSSGISEGIVVKRLVKDFNERISKFVGTRTYNGHYTFNGLQEHIIGSLQKRKNILPYLDLNHSETPTNDR